MTGSPLGDKCWALIVAHLASEPLRGKFLFMSGLTLKALQQQREQASPPEFIYGVRIMLDDTMKPDTIELKPFTAKPGLR